MMSMDRLKGGLVRWEYRCAESGWHTVWIESESGRGR